MLDADDRRQAFQACRLPEKLPSLVFQQACLTGVTIDGTPVMDERSPVMCVPPSGVLIVFVKANSVVGRDISEYLERRLRRQFM